VILFAVLFACSRFLYYRGLSLYKLRKFKKALEDFRAATDVFARLVVPSFAADWYESG